MSTPFADQAVITGPADQPILKFLGSQERLLLSGELSNGEFAILEGSGTRGHTAPLHTHRLATETFIVLTGELLIDVGGQRRHASAGQVALLPRAVPHSFLVLSPEARYLTLHTPAGFDAFVQQVSDAAHDGAPPDRTVLTALAATHGIDIVGPGLQLDQLTDDSATERR